MYANDTITRAKAETVDWHLDGLRAGPTLVIIGKGRALQRAVERLSALPTLGYLRGRLMVCSAVPQTDIDHLISLRTEVAQDAYWYILASAAKLGMIAGKGIPGRYLNAV